MKLLSTGVIRKVRIIDAEAVFIRLTPPTSKASNVWQDVKGINT
jgi:hypothetical protein